jgi:cytochrome c peroxidase
MAGAPGETRTPNLRVEIHGPPLPRGRRHISRQDGRDRESVERYYDALWGAPSVPRRKEGGAREEPERKASSLTGVAVAMLALASSGQASADDLSAHATAGEVAHKQEMSRLFPDGAAGTQPTPAVIPQVEITSDPSGQLATFQPNGATHTANNAFFQNLGTNGRTCFTCHEPQDGWGLSALDAQQRFARNPGDPLFRLVDGATCPSDNVSTAAAARAAYALVLDKGLIRIGLPMQSTMQFEIESVADPYGCNTNPTTGLTGPQSGIVSVYRRPLPAANLSFLSTIMWDGREPDLFHQAIDATEGHAQATAPPTATQQQQIVTFEGCTTANTPAACASTPAGAGVFTAQSVDSQARSLSANGAAGGPFSLSENVASFFIGINDPLGMNPTGQPFSPVIFNLFSAFSGSRDAARAAIARGEQMFDSVPIKITGVAGLNDVLNQPSVSGFCGTCHDTPNAGDHSVKAPLNIGVADAGAQSPPVLDISGLPVFTVKCIAGPLDGQTFQVTDIGRAMITGNCADIGKVKGPTLRGLAARAPYFHNGSAATLADVVEFYNQRFNIGLSTQQKSDLVAFLNAL